MTPFIEKFKNKISEALSREVRLKEPPKHVEADLAVLSKPDKSEDEAEKINEIDLGFIEEISPQGPFINLKFKEELLYDKILQNILESPDFGVSKKNEDKKALIEYSSPNIAKPIGVGHLRSTIIGESLSRIYESTGFSVHRVNYLGDWGTQFGQLKVAYEKWGDDEKIKENPLQELKDLYVKFQEEAKEDEDLNDQARKAFKKLEEGDEEMKKTWKQFREWSIEGFKEIYDRLGVEFDEYSGESYSVDKAKDQIEICLEEGLCEENEDGSIAAHFDDLPSTVLQKEDGSTLYLTRDLATLQKRIENHNPDRLLYVVDARQSLHFQQLFELAEKLDYLNDTEPIHIKFGLLMVDGEPMSTRKGTLIELEELLRKSTEKAKKIIEEKNPDLDEESRKEVSEAVGIGAIIYNDLKQDRTKNLEFDWGRMLRFKEGAGPYLQYTHARIKSILRKGEAEKEDPDLDNPTLSEPVEFEVAKKMMLFPEVVKAAARQNSPHMIANFLEELSSLFNKFYGQAPVLQAETDKLKRSRIALIKSVAGVLEKGLYLLGMEAPDEM